MVKESWRRVGLAALGIFLWAGLDRAVKIALQQDWHATFSFVRIELVKNYGLVFSWPAPAGLIFILLLAATVVVAGVLVRNFWRPSLATAGAGLMLIGALSNLIDRWNYGYVIDGFFFGPWWPVFNLADVAITVGLLLYLWPRPVDKLVAPS